MLKLVLGAPSACWSLWSSVLCMEPRSVGHSHHTVVDAWARCTPDPHRPLVKPLQGSLSCCIVHVSLPHHHDGSAAAPPPFGWQADTAQDWAMSHRIDELASLLEPRRSITFVISLRLALLGAKYLAHAESVHACVHGSASIDALGLGV